jgi:hypothetical protein
MVADGLLTRQRYREVPPRVDYELTERARDLLPVIGALARWGYQWAWGAPRDDEQLDIGAILRSVPGLAVPRGFDGSAELIVVKGNNELKYYAIGSDDDIVTFAERSAPEADCRISGDQRAWVAALGPEADRDGLQIDGKRGTAKALLDALAPVAARIAAVA